MLHRMLVAIALASVGAHALAAQPSLTAAAWDVDPATRGVLVEDHRVPVVHLRLDFPAGTWSPWGRREHIVEAFELQHYDTTGALRRRTDRLAADLSLSCGERSCSLRAACRTADLDEVLALVRDVLANRDYDRHELKRRKRGAPLEYQAALRDPEFRLWQAAARELFPEGDPRRFAYEEPPPVATDPKALAAARDRLIRLPGRLIGWAGDLSREDAERRSAGLLPAAEGAPPSDLAPELLGLRPRTAPYADVHVPMPKLTQFYFADLRPALATTDPDYPALMIADHVLGGHFYSRLYEALRHEAGDTYGAVTRQRTDVEPGTYLLYTFTKVSNAAEAEQKLRGVLARLHAGGITEDERAAAAGFLEGRRAFDRQSPVQVLDRYLFEVRRGLPPGFRERLAERAAATPLAEVNDVIRRFYDPMLFELVVVQPR